MSQAQPTTSGYVYAPRAQSGNSRRAATEDSISLMQGQRLSQPPTLKRGSQSSTAEDVQMSNEVSVGDSGIDCHRAGRDSVEIGGRSYLFNSSNGSGSSSGSELRPLQQKSSSGSKQTQHSTAADWFNTLNKDVDGNNAGRSYDDDSPYYVPSQQTKKYFVGKTRRGANEQGQKSNGSNFNSRNHSGGIFDSTEESNSDSFRSVIDDLTIKNQRLKRRLRKLEGLQGRSKQYEGERVLEVRMHGLSDVKRGELEELLQRFISTLDHSDSENQDPLTAGIESGMRMSPVPDVTQSKKLGADSGYATISRSGSTSIAPSSRNSHANAIGKGPVISSTRTRGGAHSDPELEKMAEVVQRLEQLFTGREAIRVDSNKASEQQRVSDVAQADDREAKIRSGQKFNDQEGAREASMMSPGSSRQITMDSQQHIASITKPQTVVAGSVPEQRPTRPKDLDPTREQVAEENVEYLTHMTESAVRGHSVPDGWVYLNLIINMAQLHTINVTPSFVKKAIANVSSSLELSPDGKMVRWSGGTKSENGANGGGSGSGLENRAEGNSSSEHSTGERIDSSGTLSSDEKGATECLSNTLPSGGHSGPDSRETGSTDHKFHYKPIFARADSFDDSSSHYSDNNSSLSGGEKKTGLGNFRAVHGPVIFFKGQSYYSDLCGQNPRKENLKYETAYPYERFTNNPIGSSQSMTKAPSEGKRDSPLHTMSDVVMAPEYNAMDLDQDSSSDMLDFSPRFGENKTSTPLSPIELNVSGIGDAQPADNFAIHVETKHYLFSDGIHRMAYSKSKARKSRVNRKFLHCIPKSSIDAFHELDSGETTDVSVTSSGSSTMGSLQNLPSRKRPLQHELLSTTVLKLPPSELPPASYFFGSQSATSSAIDTDDDYMPRSSGSDEYFGNFPITSYRQSSGEDVDDARWNEDKPVSSAATAGDLADKDWDDDVPFSLEEDSEEMIKGIGSGEQGDCDEYASSDSFDRPNLKRSRGSMNSSASGLCARKSQRMSAIADM